MSVVRRWCSRRSGGLGIVQALLVAWPAVAWGAAPPPVRVEATASVGLPPDELPAYEAALIDAARRGVGEAGLVEADDAGARVVVEVAWEDERRIDYVGRIEVRTEVDDAKPLAIRSFDCDMCGAGELLTRVQSEVALALATTTWPQPAAEPVTEAAAQPEGASPVRDRARLRPLGYAGAGIASAGAGAVIAGAVLWSRDDRLELRPDDPEGPVWKRSWRPPGIGLVAAGLGALVVGGTLIAVDLVRSRRRAVAWHPVIGRGLAALVVRGRF